MGSRYSVLIYPGDLLCFTHWAAVIAPQCGIASGSFIRVDYGQLWGPDSPVPGFPLPSFPGAKLFAGTWLLSLVASTL